MLVAYNLSTDGIIVVIDNTSAEIAISNEDTFVSTWKTDNAGTSGSTQITLPLEAGGTYDFGINWGDGTSSKITAYDQAEVTHTYPIAGTYTVKIDGVINGWRFNNGGDKAKITDISQWGDLLIGNSGSYFYGCSSLNVSATDVLDVSNVTNFYQAFRDCTNLDGLDISGFAIPELTTATLMIAGAHLIANYSDVLINWAAQDTIKSNVVFGAGTNTYPATTQDSGTTDGTTVSKLVQSGQNFNTTVAINDVIHNTTDNTWAVVTAVDSDTTLSIDNDIMISGEAYVIYRSAGVLAKARLIIDYDWIITDGGAE